MEKKFFGCMLMSESLCRHGKPYTYSCNEKFEKQKTK